jgi:hypothetical protein
MRTYALAFSVLALFAFTAPVATPVAAQEFGGRCEELRRACLNKDRLGERGEGNCRRFRAECRRATPRNECRELRAACLNKDRLGERGEGNCRRYRETCRGG